MPYATGYNPNIPSDKPDTSLFGGWSCEDWVTWFYAMKNAYGYDKAKANWMYEWENQSFWSSDYSWCKYSSHFSSFLETENIFGQTNIISETATGASNTINSLIDAVENTASITKYIVPAIAIGLGIILIITANRKAAAA